MKGSVTEILDSVASRACMEVFSSYRVSLRELARPSQGATDLSAFDREVGSGASQVAAVVGFTGQPMRGSLLLRTTFDVIASSRPSTLASPTLSKHSYSDWVMVRDWASEIGNQMLGRIKNKLRLFGVVLEVSTPTAFSGRALAFAKPRSALARHFLFEARGDQVWLSLDASFDPDRILVSGDEQGAKEGDILLF